MNTLSTLKKGDEIFAITRFVEGMTKEIDCIRMTLCQDPDFKDGNCYIRGRQAELLPSEIILITNTELLSVSYVYEPEVVYVFDKKKAELIYRLEYTKLTESMDDSINLLKDQISVIEKEKAAAGNKFIKVIQKLFI